MESTASLRTVTRTQTLLPLAACSLLALPVASAGAEVIVEGSNGNATVGEILGKPATFTAQERVERKTFQFRMPPGAKQGPDPWYTVRLHATATFAPGGGRGSVLLSASTNGKAAAQVEFYPGADRAGRPIVAWDSVDAFNGSRVGKERGRSAHVDYENLLQFSGVKGGFNALSFEIESFGAPDLDSIVIGPASGVYATEAGPVELRVQGGFAEAPESGQAAELEVTVSNKSPRVARDVMVALAPASERLFIEGSAVRRIERLDGEETVRFSVGRSGPGEIAVQAIASTPLGDEAETLIEASAGDGEGGDSSWLLLAGLGALACGGAAVAIGLNRRREAGR